MADEATLTETVIPPWKPKGTATIAETIRRQMFGEKPAEKPAATEPAKPAEAVKPAAEPVKTEEAPRNADGTFKTDPNKAQMREVIKRQQEEKKALEARLAALEAKAQGKPEPKPDPRREALLATMSPETRKWYETSGKELMGLEAQEVARSTLAPHERALAKADEALKAADEDARWNAEFNDWMAGKLADGEVVDERAMLAAYDACEAKGYRFGATETAHLDQILTLLRAQNPGAVAGIKTGKEAEEAAKKKADELLRAGGVRPGNGGIPDPQADRAAELKALREASFRGDSVGSYLRKRLKGQGIFPEERGMTEGG